MPADEEIAQTTTAQEVEYKEYLTSMVVGVKRPTHDWLRTPGTDGMPQTARTYKTVWYIK